MKESPLPPPPPEHPKDKRKHQLEETYEKIDRSEADGINEAYGPETLEHLSQVNLGFGRNLRKEIYNMSEKGASKEMVDKKIDSIDEFNRAMEVSIMSGDAPIEEARKREAIFDGSTVLLRKTDATVDRAPGQKLLDELKDVKGLEC